MGKLDSGGECALHVRAGRHGDRLQRGQRRHAGRGGGGAAVPPQDQLHAQEGRHRGGEQDGLGADASGEHRRLFTNKQKSLFMSNKK